MIAIRLYRLHRAAGLGRRESIALASRSLPRSAALVTNLARRAL